MTSVVIKVYIHSYEHLFSPSNASNTPPTIEQKDVYRLGQGWLWRQIPFVFQITFP